MQSPVQRRRTACMCLLDALQLDVCQQLSTINLSSTVFLGKYSLSPIVVDRHMVMNSMGSGMSTVNEGPRWRISAAKSITSCAWYRALRGCYVAPPPGIWRRRVPSVQRAPNLNIIMQHKTISALEIAITTFIVFLPDNKTATGRLRV